MNEAGLAAEQSGSAALHYLSEIVHAQALTIGFKDSFIALAAVFITALIPAWLFAKSKKT